MVSKIIQALLEKNAYSDFLEAILQWQAFDASKLTWENITTELFYHIKNNTEYRQQAANCLHRLSKNNNISITHLQREKKRISNVLLSRNQVVTNENIQRYIRQNLQYQKPKTTTYSPQYFPENLHEHLFCVSTLESVLRCFHTNKTQLLNHVYVGHFHIDYRYQQILFIYEELVPLLSYREEPEMVSIEFVYEKLKNQVLELIRNGEIFARYENDELFVSFPDLRKFFPTLERPSPPPPSPPPPPPKPRARISRLSGGLAISGEIAPKDDKDKLKGKKQDKEQKIDPYIHDLAMQEIEKFGQKETSEFLEDRSIEDEEIIEAISVDEGDILDASIEEELEEVEELFGVGDTYSISAETAEDISPFEYEETLKSIIEEEKERADTEVEPIELRDEALDFDVEMSADIQELDMEDDFFAGQPEQKPLAPPLLPDATTQEWTMDPSPPSSTDKITTGEEITSYPGGMSLPEPEPEAVLGDSPEIEDDMWYDEPPELKKPPSSAPQQMITSADEMFLQDFLLEEPTPEIEQQDDDEKSIHGTTLKDAKDESVPPLILLDIDDLDAPTSSQTVPTVDFSTSFAPPTPDDQTGIAYPPKRAKRLSRKKNLVMERVSSQPAKKISFAESKIGKLLNAIIFVPRILISIPVMIFSKISMAIFSMLQKTTQKIIHFIRKKYQIDIAGIEIPIFEAMLSEDSGRPGIIERTIAQSKWLMKSLQVTIGLRIVVFVNFFDNLVEFVAGYITNIYRTWKMGKSIKRRMQRRNPQAQIEGLNKDLETMRYQIARLFYFPNFCAHENNKECKETFALELVLDIRGHIDEMKRDLSLLTTKQMSQTIKNSFYDYIKSFIPNPLELFTPCKDFVIFVFFMKYSRKDLYIMYSEVLMSYNYIISNLDSAQQLQLKEYEENLIANQSKVYIQQDIETHIKECRLQIQRLIQVLTNPRKMIQIHHRSIEEIWYECHQSQSAHAQFYLQWEKILHEHISKVLKVKNDVWHVKDKIYFQRRYRLQKQLSAMYV